MEPISIKETLELCNRVDGGECTLGETMQVNSKLSDAFRRLAGVVSEIEDCVSHARDCGAEGFRMKFAEWDGLMARHGLEE